MSRQASAMEKVSSSRQALKNFEISSGGSLLGCPAYRVTRAWSPLRRHW